MSGEAVALVTANFGGIDKVKPLPTYHPRVKAFYYTDVDTARTASVEDTQGWDDVIVPNYPRHDFNNRLRARYFKHQIHRLDEMQGFRWLVWADANVCFKDLRIFGEWADALEALPPEKRFMAFRHNSRNTIQEEYDYVMGQMEKGDTYQLARYQYERMPEQMDWIKKMGLNTGAPLYAVTVWMVENSALMGQVLDSLWDQNLRFGLMDQIIYPLVLEHHGVTPTCPEEDLWRNKYWDVTYHQIKDK